MGITPLGLLLEVPTLLDERIDELLEETLDETLEETTLLDEERILEELKKLDALLLIELELRDALETGHPPTAP